MIERRPIVWSIAGNDSGGGAGLSADQRAADAFGVHLCPVVAAITAQNSTEVTHVEPVHASVLEAQLGALERDLPPAVVKTGLIGSAALIQVVAAWIDRLREQGAVALVVDPVLASSTGASFADDAARNAFRELLLPRADLVTPNHREARLLAGIEAATVKLASALRASGAGAVCVTGGDEPGALALDWIDTEAARGWLAAPRVQSVHTHGTGCTFATSAAAALARGFVDADAVVLAKMATSAALRYGYPAGQGAGPVAARAGFARDPSVLPAMSFGSVPPRWHAPRTATDGGVGLYAIVDSAAGVRRVLASGVRMVQLRIKEVGASQLREEIRSSIVDCRTAGALLFVNDHWKLAIELGAHGVHLGQEDLTALTEAERSELGASGLALGVSSHSLWELARSRSLVPSYIACGPVWPTALKAMPWRAQGLDNLAWWCVVAGTPVVAIGGILSAEQLRAAAACGAWQVCVLRAVAEHPESTVPALLAALSAAQSDARVEAPMLPHPTLEPTRKSAAAIRMDASLVRKAGPDAAT